MTVNEAGQMNEETGKLYYFNKYLRVRLRHWNKKVQAGEPEQLAPSHLLLNAKLLEELLLLSSLRC
jgi:hypothetical protein